MNSTNRETTWDDVTKAVTARHEKQLLADKWLACLQVLSVFPDEDLPQPRTFIVKTLTGLTPEKLQGQKHGVVFSPAVVMELTNLFKLLS